MSLIAAGSLGVQTYSLRIRDLRGVYVGARVDGRNLSRTERLDLFKNYSDSSCSQNSLCETVQNAQDNYTPLERDVIGFSNTAREAFGLHCELAAQLTNGTANPPVITVDHNGWDHHFNQYPTDVSGVFGKKVEELAGVSLSAVNTEGHTVFDGLTSLARLRRIIG